MGHIHQEGLILTKNHFNWIINIHLDRWWQIRDMRQRNIFYSMMHVALSNKITFWAITSVFA